VKVLLLAGLLLVSPGAAAWCLGSHAGSERWALAQAACSLPGEPGLD